MPAWMIPLITGALSTAGTMLTNKANRSMVDRQMGFQERMANTAVKRSVQDYRDAGLNPALAYERSAASPGGASTQLSDAVSAGVNSAQSARALQQQMRIAQEQHQETLMNTRADTMVKQRQGVAIELDQDK